MFAAIRAKLAQIHPSCRAATQLISLAADRPLLARERFSLKLHLAFCLWCRRYNRQAHLLGQAVAGLANQINDQTEPAQQRLSAQMRQKMQRRLDAALDDRAN